MGSKITVEAIRAVRERVDRTLPECRAALEKTDGDVSAAVASLQTEMERKRDHAARIFAPLGHTGTSPPRPRPAPSREQGFEKVLADLAPVIRARSLWAGAPNPSSRAALQRDHERRFGRPLVPALDAFLARWDGLEIDASTMIWGAAGRDRDALTGYDEPECDDAFVFGELLDSGYFFLRGDEVWFYDYSDPPPVFRIAPNFESFLRDALNCDLEVLGLVERARLT